MQDFVVGDVVVPRRLKYYHGADVPFYTVLRYSSCYSMLLLRGRFFSCPQWYPAENFRKANFYQPELTLEGV